MNKWKLSDIKEITNIINIYNINNETFDYLRIVDLNKVKYELSAQNTLYFLTYSEDKDVKDEFIINPFDLRKYANKIMSENPGYTYAIDQETYETLSEDNKRRKIIVFDNILKAIDSLYQRVLKNKKAKVIGVTGSVGKTTAVGIIERVLRTEKNVLRVYSKRITPIILKANLINFLDDSIEYIIMEMSIYHKDHVQILSDLLNPDIAALIGIDSSHLEFFDSIDDICVGKSAIFRHATYGFYNNLDKIAGKLSLDNKKMLFDGKKIYDTKLEHFEKIATGYKLDGDSIIVDDNKLSMFYNSELSIVQVLLAYKIGKLCNISNKNICDAINSYKPVENRLQEEVAFGKKIIFDGDITTNERIKQLAHHNYEKCYLIIRKFGSAENNKRFEKVLDSLDKFDKVFVFDDIEYLDMLSSHPNVEVVHNHDFMKNLEGKIIYHYSGYFRSFKDFDENNLINLENEKYKIMKPEE